MKKVVKRNKARADDSTNICSDLLAQLIIIGWMEFDAQRTDIVAYIRNN